jgi:hypothetical protein
MPHVIVKLWPGKSELQKQKLADKITPSDRRDASLRRGIRLGRLRKDCGKGLDGKGLQARHP